MWYGKTSFIFFQISEVLFRSFKTASLSTFMTLLLFYFFFKHENFKKSVVETQTWALHSHGTELLCCVMTLTIQTDSRLF